MQGQGNGGEVGASMERSHGDALAVMDRVERVEEAAIRALFSECSCP